MRIVTASFAVLAVGVEAPMAEFDLTRYAVTQGGLLIVVLVLLWSIRKDMKAQAELEQSRLKAENTRQTETIQVLTTLVQMNTTAMTRAAAASEANEKAAHRLSRALDNFEEGRRR